MNLQCIMWGNMSAFAALDPLTFLEEVKKKDIRCKSISFPVTSLRLSVNSYSKVPHAHSLHDHFYNSNYNDSVFFRILNKM